MDIFSYSIAQKIQPKDMDKNLAYQINLLYN